MSTTIASIERKIVRVREKLAELGPMRPGTLGRQYRDSKQKLGGFWQISYTHHMRSRSEYVRPEHLQTVKKELSNFAKFRKLSEQWIDLSLELSQLKRKQPTKK